jgi:hypothetical protein
MKANFWSNVALAGVACAGLVAGVGLVLIGQRLFSK